MDLKVFSPQCTDRVHFFRMLLSLILLIIAFFTNVIFYFKSLTWNMLSYKEKKKLYKGGKKKSVILLKSKIRLISSIVICIHPMHTKPYWYIWKNNQNNTLRYKLPKEGIDSSVPHINTRNCTPKTSPA